MNVVAIIQARMGSKRLPGKVMMDITGKPMIQHVIDRARKIKGVTDVVLATTYLPEDDILEDVYGCVFRGSPDDVLTRYYKAAIAFKADVIVRITGDCPLLNPEVSSKVLSAFGSIRNDYCSNVIQRTYPKGLDTEVMSMSALETVFKEAELPRHREHVTSYILDNISIFNFTSVVSQCSSNLINLSVDTQEDLDRVRCIYESIVCQ